MNYFLIAGEASGDLHGSRLIAALRRHDAAASFTFLGGDLMARAAGTEPLRHYRDMAYMGIVDVAAHLPTILRIMADTRRAIAEAAPDAVVLIDYPSFNLKIARYAHRLGIPVFYYIAPKVWAWKQWRVKQLRRYVERIYSILPFETEFFSRHGCGVTYTGNPSVAEIDEAAAGADSGTLSRALALAPSQPVVALLPGSRRSEIRDNLPVMLQAARAIDGCNIVLSVAPAIEPSFYREVTGGEELPATADTYALLRAARVALVTSGTATLETALIGTPQVACYRMNGSRLLAWLRRRIINVPYVTLPNLINGAATIPELLLHECTAEAIERNVRALLPDGPQRQAMLDGYAAMRHRLGTADSAATTAAAITSRLMGTKD